VLQALTLVISSNESVIARVHAAGTKDVDTAVQAAREAFDGPWGEVTCTERGRLLSRLADLVEAQAETLATVESWDGGEQSRAMVSVAS
jgi:acyl-CoA reductase-like NAD-dependent aldehyde dehydrogenase